MINGANVRTLAAEALLARVVSPAHMKIVHPPKLWLSSNIDVNVEDIKVLEALTEGDGDEIAIIESRTGRDCGSLRDNRIRQMSGVVISETSGENACRTLPVATEGGTVNVEAEASESTMISIANIARLAKLLRIESRLGSACVQIEVGHELDKEWCK
jgi:hypothetical protein